MSSDDQPQSESGLLVAAFVTLGEKIDKNTKMHESSLSNDPIRKNFGDHATTPASAVPNPFLIACNNAFPASGRFWEITDIGVYLSDGHTAISAAIPSSFPAGGTATPAPAANTVLANSPVLPPGTYTVVWSVQLEGTVAAGTDNNNFQLRANSATVIGSINPAQDGLFNQQTQTVTLLTSGTIAIRNTNAGTAGSIYTAELTATPVAGGGGNSTALIADMYAGSTAGMESPGDMQSFILSGTIPTPNGLIGDHKAYCFQNDRIYAWVYNAPANTSFSLAGTVSDWPIWARTTMEQ